MRVLGATYVWWPNIDKDIEDEVTMGKICQIYTNNPPKEPRQIMESP